MVKIENSRRIVHSWILNCGRLESNFGMFSLKFAYDVLTLSNDIQNDFLHEIVWKWKWKCPISMRTTL
jgi:hypothetical protein